MDKHSESQHVMDESLPQVDDVFNTDDLIAEYESVHKAKTCKACDDPKVSGLINALLVRGASSTTLSLFLKNKFGLEISSTTILHHKKSHTT